MTPADRLVLDTLAEVRPIVRRIGRALRLDPDDADQIAAAAAVDLARRLWPVSTDDYHLQLRQTVRWRLVDHVRRRDGRRRRLAQVPVDDVVGFADRQVMPDVADEATDRVLVERCLCMLDERSRVVVVAHAHGHTLAQIGGWLGVTESRVSQIRTAALARCRRILVS